MDLNPCLVPPVALSINKKNETTLFATVFVVLSILLHFVYAIPEDGLCRPKHVVVNNIYIYVNTTDPLSKKVLLGIGTVCL
jgi:hypothetical protein